MNAERASPQRQKRRWASITSAADHCDLSEPTIRRWIAANRLTAYRPADKVLVDLDELDALIKASANAPAGGRGAHLKDYRQQNEAAQGETVRPP
jgi:excisionase family DNA binding protein